MVYRSEESHDFCCYPGPGSSTQKADFIKVSTGQGQSRYVPVSQTRSSVPATPDFWQGPPQEYSKHYLDAVFLLPQAKREKILKDKVIHIAENFLTSERLKHIPNNPVLLAEIKSNPALIHKFNGLYQAAQRRKAALAALEA